MEFIVNKDQFVKMQDNKIVGNPNLINSKINFRGKNNILVCANNIDLENVVLDFNGDNSIVYLSSELNDFFNLEIYNNSTFYLGKNTLIGNSIKIRIYESQNVIIGDDCIIEDEVFISTSDMYGIYDTNYKERINYSNSIYIGDCVWLSFRSHVLRNVKIGSGTIINYNSVISPGSKIKSNVYVSGNPAKIIRENVFFTKDPIASFKFDDSLNSKHYKSNIFIFELINLETLNLDKIEDILKDLDVESRLEFIEKLFVRNKRKNRFTI